MQYAEPSAAQEKAQEILIKKHVVVLTALWSKQARKAGR